MILIFKKKENFLICYGLKSYEFECRCKYEHCRSSIISKELIEAYEKLRILIGRPLTINSGHRCSAHNFDVGGVALSQHTAGTGIDIDTRFFNQDIIETLAKRAGFTYIKRYKNFIHMDVR